MKRNSIILSALLACSLSSIAQSQTETFFSVTSADNQAQGMAMVLATQMAEQKAAVRILLCGPAGQLALKAYEPPALKPRNVTPKQMMAGLIKGGATVEVCALFLPNADKAPADLIEGVSVAKPPEVAAYMVKSGVRAFGF
ncbi:MAG: DsrE family protein [Comamonadaceae bacterium]|nr:DsrE family protein [Comamonadaceae bacterium]MBK7990208.1 DsrE family protein [Comamonadaceae bacterium]